MLEKIQFQNNIIALILRASFKFDGIQFFTPPDIFQQLGYMNWPKGFEVEPHFHNKIIREINLTQEVLFIKSGKIKLDLYDSNKNLVKSCILCQGDTALLVAGGHGLTMIEQSEIIEVKNGPYIGDKDKTRFNVL